MKLLVISDLHLTKRFNKKLFEKLYSLIDSSDQVIINGDFWEGYSFSFQKFINSKWKQLFPILKRKQTIYIYGNHDAFSKLSEEAYKFADNVFESYELTIGGKEFLFLHGHTVVPSFDLRHPRFINPITSFIFLRSMPLLIRTVGKRAYVRNGPYYNSLLKKYGKEKNKTLITGHSHEFEVQSDFANSGFIGYGYFSYLLINEMGEIQGIQERY